MISNGMLFVDADAFVALYNPKDSNHTLAKKCLEYIENRKLDLVTSELVLLETATVLTNKAKNLSKKGIKKIIEDTLTSNYKVLGLESTAFAEALKRFNEQTTRKINTFDCYHMSQMSREGITVVFTFDKGYKNKKNGFTLLCDLLHG